MKVKIYYNDADNSQSARFQVDGAGVSVNACILKFTVHDPRVSPCSVIGQLLGQVGFDTNTDFDAANFNSVTVLNFLLYF